MAETAITAVLSKFGELALREADVLLQVGNDIMLLRDRLEWLQAFIRAADRKRRLGTDDFTRVWVRQTRDVAFEAEDALDEFFHKVDLESQGYRGWKIWSRYVTGCSSQITVRHGLAGGIKRIKSRLDQISENQKEYKIDHAPAGIWTPSVTALAAWDNFKETVGLHQHWTTFKNLLLPKNGGYSHRAFISILGESGIGKDTLVDMVYSHIPKEDHFDVLVWYSMPPDCSTEDLLKEVYTRALAELRIKLAPQELKPQEEGIDIAEKLSALLDKKRYLVIIGGMSSKTILNCVRASLPDDENGSRVVFILEPEGEQIARHADTLNYRGPPQNRAINSIIRMKRLNKDESGDLFRLRVFGERRPQEVYGSWDALEDNSEQVKTMEKNSYDQDVYDISGGHPLAIVVLAGLLRSKEKPVEWDTVLQQLKAGVGSEGTQWNQVTGVLLSKVEWEALLQQLSPSTETKLSNRMSIDRIFSASFDDLPHDLKSCFLYFAAYPKNIVHFTDQLVRMWTAEGFITPQKGKTTEELGHDYLKELVSRCLVMVNQKNALDEIDAVRVHNRLLGFMQSEAREANFIEVHDSNNVLAPATVRRLSIQNDRGNYTPSYTKFPKLRSFICRVEEDDESTVGAVTEKMHNSKHDFKFPCCVISCSTREEQRGDNKASTKYKPNHDLKFLFGSKFLRVISVQGLRVQELPDEIGDMIHLRYLRVSCPDLKKLPSTIRRLLNLQTLDIKGTQVEEIDPKFWKIRVLRHVLAENLTLPKSIMNELDELQTLHGVRPNTEKWVVGSCPLDKMTNLRSLELQGFLAIHHGEALASALTNMHILGDLKLTGDEIPSCVFTAPSLRCIQTLEIEGNVKWSEITSDVSKLRPNLVMLKSKAKVPQNITEKVRFNETA